MCTVPPRPLQIAEANRSATNCLLPRRSCSGSSSASLVGETLASPLAIPILAIVQGLCLCFSEIEKRRGRAVDALPGQGIAWGPPPSRNPATELCEGESPHNTMLHRCRFLPQFCQRTKLLLLFLLAGALAILLVAAHAEGRRKLS